MTTLPMAEWEASLDEMEATLGAALAALDRYQTQWEKLLAESAARPAELPPLEGRLAEWDTRLRAAAELAESVERELHDREGAVGRWRESVSRWREVIEQGVGPHAVS